VQSFKTNFDFTATTPFEILGSFLALAVESVGIGIFFGLFSSLMFKWFRFLTHSAITETLLLIIIAFIAYFISEALELSGIISLLTCGISMAHYTWYNLSPQGKTISSVAVSILGSAAESLVFSYIGLCTFTYASDQQNGDYPWSLSFIMVMMGIIIVGRLTAVWGVHFALSMCAKEKDITIPELAFISYGGMIRGAIAFGLVLKIPEGDDGTGEFRERGVIVTTTLAVVIITTVLFGSFMPLVQKLLMGDSKQP
jgi:NhaP-type Na+/H+ or K+/H+ antiporter